MAARLETIFVKETTSTSAHVKQLIAEGQQLPFAVIADSQSSGHGQQGRTWHSPEGNGYLSLAVPADQLDIKASPLVPLWVAAAVAVFLQKRLGIAPTLKWPNDILFGGRKLGGILCETSTSGGKLSHVIIGIGINIHHAPNLSDSEKNNGSLVQPTTCLKDMLDGTDQWRKQEDVRDFMGLVAGQLCLQWQQGWQDVHWLADYERFHIAEGQPFLNEGQELSPAAGKWLWQGITVDGHSQWQNREGEQTLSSGNHGLKWAMQRLADQPLLLLQVDIGNTATKIEIRRISEDAITVVEHRSFINTITDDELRPQLRQLIQSHGGQIASGYCVGVNPPMRTRLTEICREEGLNLYNLIPRPVRMASSVYDQAQMGRDRKTLIEGALAHRRYRGRELVIVSMGTATTIDAIDSYHAHVGGYILAGLQTQLDSLGKKGAQLPSLSLVADNNPLPTLADHLDKGGILAATTEEAIIYGTLRSLYAMANGVAEARQKASGREVAVILTGGYADALAGFANWIYHPSLLMDGLTSIVLGGYDPSGA